VQKNGSERGFNTSNGAPYDDKSGTVALPLNYVPIIKGGSGGYYREFILDANENNDAQGDWRLSVDTFDIWVCNDNGANMYTTFAQFEGNPTSCKKVYDLGGHVGFATDALTSGSGKTLDYDILIPEKAFTDAFPDAETKCVYQGVTATACGYWVIVRALMGAFGTDANGHSWASDATFEEFSTIKRPYIVATKDAHTSLTRTYQWDIEKTVDKDSWQFLNGETGTSTYTVKVTKTGSTDGNWAVSGTVSIQNPSDQDVQIESVVDVISGGGGADISVSTSCDNITAGNPYTLLAGGTLNCTYGPVSLPDANPRTNTATVTLVDLGVNSATATIDFSSATVNEVNGTIDVVDKFDDQTETSLGSASDTKTFSTFTRTFSCDDVPSKHNVATIVQTGQNDDATVSIVCGKLEVTKDATTSLKRTHHWTINKTVAPDVWNLFTGDAGTSTYTVKVTKTGSTDSDWKVTGTITIHNPSTFAIDVAKIADTVSTSLEATIDCGSVTFPYTLAPDADLVCTYGRDLPDASDRTNTATARVSDAIAFTGSADVSFTGATVDEVNPSIHVDDTNGSSWDFTDSGTKTYDTKFTCDADNGKHDNTATIKETGDDASALVTVNCYTPKVTKDASTSFRRTWTWTIDKTIDATCFLQLPGGDSYDDATHTVTIQSTEDIDVCYNAKIDASSTDDEFKVTGNITVTNPNPARDAVITALSDVLAGPVNGTVDCGSTFPITLAKDGGELKCTYSMAPSDATGGTNTATATLENHSYASDGTATVSGSSDYDGTATATFASTPTTEIDECVDVGDLLQKAGVDAGSKSLGTWCASQGLPHTFSYYYSFGPNGIPVVCGDNVFDNTAKLTTNDTKTEKTDGESVNISVQCVTGCTLTLGYWKTHNNSFSGGASKKADPTWTLLSGGLAEKSIFFLSGQTWYQVFWTKPQGNAYYILADQYMAAVLNGLAGADQGAITTVLAQAKALFETYTPAQVAALKGPTGNALRQQFLDLANTLDQYNQGVIGPGHCTENAST
jgi:hypothetical protein